VALFLLRLEFPDRFLRSPDSPSDFTSGLFELFTLLPPARATSGPPERVSESANGAEFVDGDGRFPSLLFIFSDALALCVGMSNNARARIAVKIHSFQSWVGMIRLLTWG
jgi:hypothetical protein